MFLLRFVVAALLVSLCIVTFPINTTSFLLNLPTAALASSLYTSSTTTRTATSAALITTRLAAAATSSIESDPPIRIGHGFDIHRLSEGLELVIGGVKIPFEKGAEAHSDGDVIYHSVVDAILGALGLPDIGQIFPDNDPKWKGADSSVFMDEAYARMVERGYRIGNVDVTLILQKPKVKDIKPEMKDNIVRLLKTSSSRVNVKARTHEKVDSVGKSEAMACHVVVLLEKV